MSLLYKGVASQVVMLKLFLTSDHVSAATGKTVAIKISKNGGAFADPNAGATNATEVSSGWDKVTLDATDTATEGDLVVRGTATSCDDTERVFRVHLPANFGVASIDSNGRLDVIKIAGTTQTARDVGASVLLSAGTGTGQLDFTAGVVKSNVTQFGSSAGTFAGGRPEVNTTHAAGTAWGSGAITAASIAADAITDAKVAADVTIASVTGSVGSVAGAVGSVTGAVGSVTGAVGSIAAGGISSSSFAAGAITASSIAADAIGASELAADAVTEIAGAVWDITLSSHLTGGTTGAALNAAGSAGDPWSTALPGAYTAGSAGYIIGTNLDAKVSLRLPTASYTAPLDAAGTRSALGLASANLDTQLDAIPTAVENADALLKRDFSSVTGEAARSLLNAMRFLRNKWTNSGGTLTVMKEDDSTTAWTATTTTTAGDPVSSVDPA